MRVMSSSKEPASASAGPGADQGTYRAMAEAVCQVGGGDACAEAPACQGWYRVLAPVGIEGEHACCQDQAVDGVKGTRRAVRPISPWVLTSS